VTDEPDGFQLQTFCPSCGDGVLPLEGGLYATFQFWIHWAICPFCRRYRKEINEIAKIQRTQSNLRNHPAVRVLEVKQRLKEKLIRRAS